MFAEVSPVCCGGEKKKEGIGILLLYYVLVLDCFSLPPFFPLSPSLSPSPPSDCKRD